MTTRKEGTGPDAVRGLTYFEIQRQQQAELDLAIKRKPGALIPTLPVGQVPFNKANVWNTDRGVEPLIGEGEDG
jgi:hypothetical protein